MPRTRRTAERTTTKSIQRSEDMFSEALLIGLAVGLSLLFYASALVVPRLVLSLRKRWLQRKKNHEKE